jgi:hypothetical protein
MALKVILSGKLPKNHIATTVFNYDKSQYFHENGLLFSDKEVQEFESYVEEMKSNFLKHKRNRPQGD